MKTRLLLIRHGQSEANLQGIYAGHSDADLTQLGEQQAVLTAEYIVKNFDVDGIYASDLKRAYSTGRAVADRTGLDVHSIRELREIFAGNWEGVPFEVLQKEYETEYACWINDIGNCRCTGGESVAELKERILSALTKIAQENAGKTIVIATHATPIRAMQCYWSNLELDAMKDIPWVSNASVTEVVYEDGRWELCEIGHDTHLKDLKTVLPDNV